MKFKRGRAILALLGAVDIVLALPPRTPGPPHIDAIEAFLESGRVNQALTDADKLLASLDPQDRMVSWEYTPERRQRLGSVWGIGSSVLLLTASGHAALVLDARTGARVGELPLPTAAHLSLQLAPSGKAGELLLLYPEGLAVADTSTWQITETIKGTFDNHIKPVPFKDGFLVKQRGSRAGGLVLVTRAGSQRWHCDLPGHVRSQPVLHGNLLIVQTRRSGYGGQATSMIDTEQGTILWSKVTDAYGCGADFADDATYVVETTTNFRRGKVAGVVTCRTPRTGDVLWEFRRPGGTSWAPLVEKQRNRVFAIFDEGAVLCLNGKDGRVLWESHLPARPSQHPTEHSTNPHWSAMRYVRDSVTVLDATGSLNVLNPEDGSRRARFPLVAPYKLEQERRGLWYEIVATPWISEGNLIVPRRYRTTAYPVGRCLSASDPLELRARAVRAKALVRTGDMKGAQSEFAKLYAAAPLSERTLDCGIEIFAARGDQDKEVILRTQLLRVSKAQADPRLRELTGLLRCLSCGHGATPPLLLGARILVGGKDGLLRAYDADRLVPAGKLDLKAGIRPPLVRHGETVVFSCGDRTVRGVSSRLDRVLFTGSVSNTSMFFADLSGTLVRSQGKLDFEAAAALDTEGRHVAAMMEIAKATNAPVLHEGVLYYPQKGGGSVGYDGADAHTYPPILEVKEYRVNPDSDRPVAYGDGGVYAVDDHLRPNAHLVTCPDRAYAAAVNDDVVAVLRGDRLRSFLDYQLELWRSGAKLSFRFQTPRYGGSLHTWPRLVALGGGFLLIGRDLVYVEADREKPVWRFWPGESGIFAGPVVHGERLFFTHSSGALFVFLPPGSR